MPGLDVPISMLGVRAQTEPVPPGRLGRGASRTHSLQDTHPAGHTARRTHIPRPPIPRLSPRLPCTHKGLVFRTNQLLEVGRIPHLDYRGSPGLCFGAQQSRRRSEPHPGASSASLCSREKGWGSPARGTESWQGAGLYTAHLAALPSLLPVWLHVRSSHH